MDQQKLQFRVGLFVLVSLSIAGVLIVRFGDLRSYWEERYALAIQFDAAPGVFPGTPVRVNGVLIGRTRAVLLDDAEAGVLVIVDIDADRRLRTDSQPVIVRSLLGDSSIEFSAGASPDYIAPNMRLRGLSPQDPMDIVRRMEEQLGVVVASFDATSAEWRKVGENFNGLMETERGHLTQVIEKTALAIDDFARTMQAAQEALANANAVVADPEIQRRLRETIAALPELVQETRDTIAAARLSVQRSGESLQKININLDQVQQATAPLAENSRQLVTRLDGGLVQLESLLTELHAFARVLNDKDGTVQRLVADPRLYDNLNKSAGAMSLLLENLEPTLRDVRIFADKVARHPEILGVSGAISGSTGLKEAPEGPPRQSAQPSGAMR